MKFSCPSAKRKREKGPGNWALEILALPRDEWVEYFEMVPESMKVTVRYHVKRALYLEAKEAKDKENLRGYRVKI